MYVESWKEGLTAEAGWNIGCKIWKIYTNVILNSLYLCSVQHHRFCTGYFDLVRTVKFKWLLLPLLFSLKIYPRGQIWKGPLNSLLTFNFRNPRNFFKKSLALAKSLERGQHKMLNKKLVGRLLTSATWGKPWYLLMHWRRQNA